MVLIFIFSYIFPNGFFVTSAYMATYKLKQKTLFAKIAKGLTPNQRSFFAEVIGTFIVVLATGSVVIDAS